MTLRTRLIAAAKRAAHFEEAAVAAPGTRFTTRYEARVRERGVRWRPSRIGLAVALFTIGMLNVFVPGPGGSVFIFASALVLSGESRRFAALLDRAELRFQRQASWMLAHPLLVSCAITLTVLVVLAALGRVLIPA